MNNITPCFWCDNNALQAAEFYTSLFDNSKIDNVSHYLDDQIMPAGTVLTVEFTLSGQDFMTLNGEPVFPKTPAISFFVHCDTTEEVDKYWNELIKGGSELMPLGEYPFSAKYGWLVDQFGLSWQIGLSKSEFKITPFLMYFGDNFGKAEEAASFYLSIFKNVSLVNKTETNTFRLENLDFVTFDSNVNHAFTFSEGISFVVNCDNQEEIDYYWDAFTKDGEESECGWLKDKYGVSWQIVNKDFNTLIPEDDPVTAQRVFDAMYQMKKLNIQALKDAFENK